MEAKSLVLGCFLSFVTILVLFPTPTEAGECCRYRSFLYGRRTHDSRWCPVYCCYSRTYGTYSCCGDITKRAEYHDRSAFCKDWFTFRSNL
ncbi:Hypothetical predicted protein [Mytilus galloprovincialis]|uniref:Uncharacterized protein n=1 Tax=Mytilus galloprovincialis TaxID=29158 RepID=A0A8B6BQE3_MYTGA|nr:Hypothetical predicted protein [Mytilus galloprovincialis]